LYVLNVVREDWLREIQNLDLASAKTEEMLRWSIFELGWQIASASNLTGRSAQLFCLNLTLQVTRTGACFCTNDITAWCKDFSTGNEDVQWFVLASWRIRNRSGIEKAVS